MKKNQIWLPSENISKQVPNEEKFVWFGFVLHSPATFLRTYNWSVDLIDLKSWERRRFKWP